MPAFFQCILKSSSKIFLSRIWLETVFYDLRLLPFPGPVNNKYVEVKGHDSRVFCPKRVISKLLCLMHTHIFLQVLLFSLTCLFYLKLLWHLKFWWSQDTCYYLNTEDVSFNYACFYCMCVYHFFKQSSQTDLRLSSFSSLYLADEFDQWGICVKIHFCVLCWNGFWFFFSCSVHATREKMAYSVECLRDYV